MDLRNRTAVTQPEMFRSFVYGIGLVVYAYGIELSLPWPECLGCLELDMLSPRTFLNRCHKKDAGP